MVALVNEVFAVLSVLGLVTADRPSVLLFCVDDLRPEIGSFHPWSPNDTIITPHLDSLAAQGTLFTNAVVQFALCAPSRTSFLTSLRPDSTRIWEIGPFFRNVTARGRAAVTLPEAFKSAGYHTESFGKVFHVSAACYQTPVITGGKKGCLNDPTSWSVPAWLPNPYAERGNSTTAEGRNPTGPFNPDLLSWVAYDAPDNEFPDGNISMHATMALRRIRANISSQPFFLGVGFLKPHLPQVFPEKYLQIYAKISPPSLATNPFPPIGSPSVATAGFMQEISEYTNIVASKYGNTTKGPYDLPKTVQLGQKLAYHAATTFIDAQIGRVLNELKDLGFRNNTIVAVIGDHGWKLGEHGGWAKKTNYYNDARGLLIISDPRQQAPGHRVHGVVEYIDVMPTLLELAMPNYPIPRNLEGKSFAHLLHSPTEAHRPLGFYQYTCEGVISCMGYSVVSVVRPERMRYTEWVSFDRGTAIANFSRPVASAELYDHNIDAEENYNVAEQTRYADVQRRLSAALRANFERP